MCVVFPTEYVFAYANWIKMKKEKIKTKKHNFHWAWVVCLSVNDPTFTTETMIKSNRLNRQAINVMWYYLLSVHRHFYYVLILFNLTTMNILSRNTIMDVMILWRTYIILLHRCLIAIALTLEIAVNRIYRL